MRNYTDLIGTPFEWGARGPDKFDCWGLLKHLFAQDGVTIPDYRSPEEQEDVSRIVARELRLWRKCECRPGAVVLLRINGFNSHVGYVIDHNRFIHTMRDTGGVLIERLDVWGRRVAGFYEYVGSDPRA